MKRALVLLSAAALALAGCQDEKTPTTASADESMQVEQTQIEQPELDIATIDVASDNAHNANNALDWNGTYSGVLPCADCQGIETTIILNHDGSYQISQNYLGKEDGYFESQGQLSWDDAGSTITLENEGGANQYFVGENVLFKLDMNGEKAQGELAEHYQLKKSN